MPFREKFDWTLVDWNQPTSAIAKKLGASCNAVSKKRKKLAPETVGKHRPEYRDIEERRKRMARIKQSLFLRICEECGKEFLGANNALTCSKKCRRLRSSRLQNDYDRSNRPYYRKTCIVCKSPFWTSKSNQLACSTPCMVKNYKNKQEQSRKAQMRQENINNIKKIIK